MEEKMSDLKFHEATELIPHMGQQEYERLRDDIAENGMIEPIVVLGDRIIDGRHRYRACRELGIKPRTRMWEGTGSVIRYVLSANLHRRHLTTAQRAMIAAEIRPMFVAEAKKRHGKRTGISANLRVLGSGKSSEQVAAMMRVSARSVDTASLILHRGIAELSGMVKKGEISTAAAGKIAVLPVEKQKEIVALGDRKKIRNAVSHRSRSNDREKEQGGKGNEFEELLDLMAKAHVLLAGRSPEQVAALFMQKITNAGRPASDRLAANLDGARIFCEISRLNAPRMQIAS